jgi:hypothetical protein
VTERWGHDSYEEGAQWWRSLSAKEKDDFGRRALDIAAQFGQAHAAGRRPDSDEVQALVRRHYEWVQAGWQGRRPTAEQFAGLGQMYVDDPRFARTYDRHGEGTAAFVRDAMAVFADRSL